MLYVKTKCGATTTKEPTTPDISPPQSESANEHKERGNECIRKANYTEAILHYSFAIKLSPAEATFYSNRSLAFLKCNQLYYANEDADKAIQLTPDWAKVLELLILKKRNKNVYLCNHILYSSRVISEKVCATSIFSISSEKS